MDTHVTLLHDFLTRAAERFPDHVALVCNTGRMSYAELERDANRLARTLRAAGIERGDRVIIYMPNCAEAVIALWGVLKANAVFSIINPTTKADKLSWYINNAGAKALLAVHSLRSIVEKVLPSSPSLHTLVCTGPAESRGWSGRTVSWAEATDGALPDSPPPRSAIDADLASLIYTSGSTGSPKGVMMTHLNMLTAATSISTYLEERAEDVILDVMPLSFDYGLYQLLMAARVGARVVLEPSFSTPVDALRKVGEERVTGFPGVPTIFSIMAGMKHLDRFDFSTVRFVTNTAAALALKHIEFLQQTFPHARIFSMYGLTECKRCTYLPPADLARKPTSIGIAIPNTELWIVDENDQRLGADQVGQLVIRGSTVMRGYWGNPTATAEKLRPGPLPGEHVLYTGDLCRLDDEGYLYFVSRMDDIIKSRGEKVAPKEIENVLYDLPGVQHAAVIGVDDEILGQAIKAFVVPEPGVTLSERAVLAHCSRFLENYMLPKYVEIVAELPLTVSGKIKKTGLR